MTLKKGFGTPVRYLFYQPMDEKIKTWTLRFPTKEIVLQYDVKAKYRLINIFGHEVFLPESSLNPTKSHARL